MNIRQTEEERLQGQRLEGETVQEERLQGQRPPAERLTTADVARGASVQSEREESHVTGGRDTAAAASTPLFPSDITEEFRTRWTDIQTEFVDTPRQAVERADELVAEAMKRLAESFAGERSRLEGEWARKGDVSTEDLRLALQHYRSFFERLLHI